MPRTLQSWSIGGCAGRRPPGGLGLPVRLCTWREGDETCDRPVRAANATFCEAHARSARKEKTRALMERILAIARAPGRPSRLKFEALQELANRLEGKPVSSMQLSGPEGAPLVPETTAEEVCRQVDRIAERLAERDRHEAEERGETVDEVDPGGKP